MTEASNEGATLPTGSDNPQKGGTFETPCYPYEMRPLFVLPFLMLACSSGPQSVTAPKSSETKSYRAARVAALDVVNDCRSRGFEVTVERKDVACRQWVHYEVHCQDDSVASYAKLVCDERDDFCSREADVCHKAE